MLVSIVHAVLPCATHLVQTGFELVDLGFLDQDVLLVKLFNNVFVAVFAVNVDQHCLDGGIALNERT